MADKPQTLRAQVQAGSQARSTSSHGRGGAGNINSKPGAATNPDDLKTPNLKGQHYTTGRGGSGNIVSNDNPAVARLAQDVETPLHHEKEPTGTYHWGRGGEGNMMTLGSNKAPKERTSSKGEKDRRRGSFQQGVIEKGKEMFGIRQGKKDEGSAIEEDSKEA
ncbi:hypothetical protein B0A50_04893 [Salinomyces thailandicus]|uniref:Uncharacterized protein n=1 Tax=Salinomyces thailandicus TaxID=706561 RepID=A0A4U0U049_9PEZI|nr:hypothetical protein B0A50_04893 [Salinomyces thailandica]